LVRLCSLFVSDLGWAAPNLLLIQSPTLVAGNAIGATKARREDAGGKNDQRGGQTRSVSHFDPANALLCRGQHGISSFQERIVSSRTQPSFSTV